MPCLRRKCVTIILFSPKPLADKDPCRHGCQISPGFVRLESCRGSFTEWLSDGIERHGLYLHAEDQYPAKG